MEHAEKVGFVIFPAGHEAAEIMEPSKKALDPPALAVTAEFAAVLSALSAAIELVRCGEPDAVLFPKALI